MNPIRTLALIGALAFLPQAVVALAAPESTAVRLATAPQESMRQVVPGRDFQEQKLLTPGLTDVWKLDVDLDEMLWCQVDSDAFDPVLDFVDTNGAVLASDDGKGTHSELWLRSAAKGAVEFRVRPYQGSGGGVYRFWLHRFRTERLGANDEAVHVFGREQWWHYRVLLQEGEVLVPTALGDGRLTGVFGADRSALPETHGGYRAPATGDYFVRIEGPEGKQCQTLTQLARRAELVNGTAIDAVVAPYGLDHFRLHVAAGAAFVLELSMPAAQLAHDLVDVAPTNEGPAFVIAGHFDKGGRVRRYCFARRDVSFDLRLRNHGCSPAPYRVLVALPEHALAVGDHISARLEVGDGVLYRLPLVSGELVRIELESTCFDGKFDLWDEQGNVIASVDDRGPIDTDPSHTFLVPASGTFRVLAHSAGGIGAGDFTLCVDALEVPTLQPCVPTPVHVEAGKTRYLHLDLLAGQEVWLSVRSRAFDAFLTVLDPVGNDSFRCDRGGLGADVLVAYRCSHTGRHTLLVQSRRGSGDGEVKVVPQ
ncbi:MAG: hypothetical protein ABIP94_04955 [Planctomycetota bacterium]